MLFYDIKKLKFTLGVLNRHNYDEHVLRNKNPWNFSFFHIHVFVLKPLFLKQE